MDKRIFTIGLVAALAVSVFVNIALYFQNLSVNQQKADFNAYCSKFGNVSLRGISYNLSPPVSMYRALTIALESDGWNTTSLENMTISVFFDYCEFYAYYNNTLGILGGSEPLYEVTQPVADYSPVTVNNATGSTTYRYIWAIVLTDRSVNDLSPAGSYSIDAATAEIISTWPPI